MNSSIYTNLSFMGFLYNAEVDIKNQEKKDEEEKIKKLEEKNALDGFSIGEQHSVVKPETLNSGRMYFLNRISQNTKG